jgi:hypothetical protein
MAKSTKRVPVIGKPDQPYWRAEDMPWDHIENEAGIHFSEKDREEIFHCAFFSSIERSLATQAASAADIENLRKRLVDHASAISELARSYRSPDGCFKNDEAEAMFLGMLISSSHPDFDLGSSLRKAASACDEIVAALSASNTNCYATEKSSEVLELAHFIAKALKCAEKWPARNRINLKSGPSAHEYWRWGIHLSPKLEPFARMCGAVLNRPVSTGQLSNAFDVVRELKLLPRQ